jgi:predicted membrane-bound mannosyltransferase/DNA-binding beta-propeller fold protein YncE
MQATIKNHNSWLDHPLITSIVLNGETIAFAVIFILGIFSRFYDLGARVMSHDENSHVYYSWRFYKGQGFAHDPLMHGPFQFHFIALSYFLFGDNDFTARILAATLSVLTVVFIWNYRRYLGRAGALVAATMMLISPYMLYYGRYVRNEAYVAFFGVVTLWAVLRYLETGQPRYMYWLTAATVLHFTAKETAFIYTAQVLVFLGLYFVYRVSSQQRAVMWKDPDHRRNFIIALIVALLLLSILGGVFLLSREAGQLSATETAAPVVPGDELTPLPSSGPPVLQLVLAILGVFAIGVAGYFLLQGYTWQRLRKDRSFSLIILLGTLVLPQLSAFPVRMVGWTTPTNASAVIALTTTDILRIAVFLVPLVLISAAVGVLWDQREWLINAAIFYGLFTIFYTSIFTNGAGFFTGLVGSLGYWLEQQGVQRGSQPSYYYWLIQVPVYEYLPALGTLLAFGVAFYKRLQRQRELVEIEDKEEEEYSNGSELDSMIAVDEYGELEVQEQPPVFGLLSFFAVTSLLAYSVAGEKMPWLTVHIAWPAILTAAWGLGKIIESTDWSAFRRQSGWLILVLLPVFVLSLLAATGSFLGPEPPFQGKTLDQLQATSTFLTSFLVALASGIGLYYLLKTLSFGQTLRVVILFGFAFLGFLTARSAILATYIHYDDANELLVYAHSAPGVKIALNQIEEISLRTTDGLDLEVAYDNETSYPYWWYLRNYPKAMYYGDNPSRNLREKPAILVGDANFGKIEPVVGNQFYRFDYIRLWWPNQDYFGLTWERVWNALSSPQMRAALFNIWLSRDYTYYGEVTGKDMSLTQWSPSARMRLYIRKDIVNQMWNYGAPPVPEIVEPDPFEGKHIELSADTVIGVPGTEPGQFNRPRDLAVASDGSLYVVDTDNSRIQHLAADGSVMQVWGSFGDATTGPAAGGTFNQPWGIGLGPDGSVYIADTWNHRIQKFSPEGEFLTMWGYFGQAESPLAFWGPRDVAVDAEGRVYVTDTGNKRVVVFDGRGTFITQFGSAGMGPGEFDEPVGISIDQNGLIYVADTWNQRIQVFTEGEDGSYLPLRNWDLLAWYGQSLDNKPYLAAGGGYVFAADPEGYRILQFTDTGEAVRSWGDYGTALNAFGMPASVAIDLQGNVWVTDAGNSRVMHFSLP